MELSPSLGALSNQPYKLLVLVKLICALQLLFCDVYEDWQVMFYILKAAIVNNC